MIPSTAWWEQHADRAHVWGEVGDLAWNAGVDHCLAMVRTMMRLAPAYDRRARVLDLGCGLGRLSVPLAHYGLHIVGVDAAHPMIDQARAAAAAGGVADRTEFRLIDSGVLPASLGSFDAAFAVLLFQHIEFPLVERYIQEVARLLRPGAGFVAQYVSAPHPDGFLSYSHAPNAVARAAELAGLREVERATDSRYPEWTWHAWERE